jgi:hypothetical protein
VVMKKQVDGIRRKPQKTEEIDGKKVTTEYAITGVPPFVGSGSVELGFTRRLRSGSVSRWEAHPVAEIPDVISVSEHKDHTAAVGALIAVYRNGGSPAVAVPEAAQEKPARKPRAADKPKADKPKADKPKAVTRKSRGRKAEAVDPSPGETSSGGTAPSAGTGPAERPLSQEAALEAVEQPSEPSWDEGYPEPRAARDEPEPLPDPFAPGPFSDAPGSGFVL